MGVAEKQQISDPAEFFKGVERLGPLSGERDPEKGALAKLCNDFAIPGLKEPGFAELIRKPAPNTPNTPGMS